MRNQVTSGGKTLRFRTVEGLTFEGKVKNPQAILGSVAARLAAKAGIAGVFEMVDPQGMTLDPNATLASLPEEEITMVPSYTPA